MALHFCRPLCARPFHVPFIDSGTKSATTSMRQWRRRSRRDGKAEGALQTQCAAVAQPTSFDSGVFLGVVATVGKLALICGVIRFLTRTGRVPTNASTVLSKVSYQLVIPCLLFTRVTSLLISKDAPISLLGLSVAMILQVLVGALLGWLSWRIVTWVQSMRKSLTNPHASTRLEGHSHGFSEVKHKELGLLAILLSAFCNVWTLPVLFLSTLYPAQAELAIGYIAFCVVGWSPLFWALGPVATQLYSSDAAHTPSRVSQLLKGLKGILNPPTIALVSAFFLSSFPLGRALLSGGLSQGPLLQRCLAAVVHPILDATRTIASAGIAMQAIILGAAFSVDAGNADDQNPQKLTSPSRSLSLPSMSSESLALMCVAAVRFLLMPFVGWISLNCVTRLGWIPVDDILSRMTVLIMSVMPPAQNAVVLLDLQPETRHLVPDVARAVIGLYVAAIVPITFWACGACYGQAPAPGPDGDGLLSDTFVYNLNEQDYEGTLFTTGDTDAGPLVLFVADPFGVDVEGEMEVIMQLTGQGYTVAMIDTYGNFRNANAFMETLGEDPESMIVHVATAWRILGVNPAFFDSDRAVVGHGLGAALAIEAARLGTLDVEAVVAISPTSLRVSPLEVFTYKRPVAVYLSHNGPIESKDIFSFENELRLLNSSYEVTRFSTAEEDILDDARAKERMLSLMTTFLSMAFDPDQLEYLSEPFNETNVNDNELGFQYIDYKDGDDDLRSFLAYPLNPPTDNPLPLVLIAPDWDGIAEFEFWRAKLLAHSGYVALAADIFGADVVQGDDLPFLERQRLTSEYGGTPFVGRLTAAIDAIAESDLVNVDLDRIAMIGYCFGGSGILEAAAAAVPGLKGVVTFHAGILIPETVTNEECQPVSVVVLNGADDAMVTINEINNFFDRSTELDVNWEFTNYGATIHGFAVPTYKRRHPTLAYNPFADVLSFASLQDFLQKIFMEPELYEKCKTE